MNSLLMIAYLNFGFVLVLINCTLTTGDLSQQYIGCYRDDGSNRAMGGGISSTSMTLEMCFELCRNTTFTFFGVAYWYECYCADTFNKHGPADNCSTPCGGNLSQICGGNGALSVYTVCPTGKYRRHCNNSCGHCENSAVYGTVCFRNGTCPAGCQTGWNGTKCEQDINECATHNGNCSHSCTNSPGSRMCSCRNGYRLDTDDRTCLDIDECSNQNGRCQHNCNNSVGSFNCYCNQGFQLINSTHCKDIDECLSGNGGCEVNCANTQGSYYCSCKDGYRLNDDRKTCSDIDECLDSSKHQCSQNCSNSPGTYSCYCMNGFTLNGDRKTCDDYDECANKTLNLCAQKCENTPGSFRCLCNTPNTDGNAAYSVSANGFSCDNINECAAKTDKCDHYCFDTHGDYECSCSAGYTLSKTDNRKCTYVPWPPGASITVAVFVVLAILLASIVGYLSYKLRHHSAATQPVLNDKQGNSPANETNLQQMSVYNFVDDNTAATCTPGDSLGASHAASVEATAGYMQLDTKQEALYVNNVGDMYEAIRKF